MRSAYWDNWKGAAVLAVVAIHACNGTEAFPVGSFNWAFGLTLRQVINFAVPMFLAMAGYFSANAATMGTDEYFGRRIQRIVLPYLFWTALYLLTRTPSTIPDAQEIFEGVFWGTGIGIGYYVIVLLQFTLLTPLLVRIHSRAVHALVIVVMTSFGVAFTYYFRTQQPGHFFATFPGSGLPFPVWYVFYHLGLLVALYKRDVRPSSIVLLLGYIGALGLAIAEAFYWAGEGMYDFGASQTKVGSFLASLMLFLLAVTSEDCAWLSARTWVTWIGENSFAFYLIHLIFLKLSTSVLSKFVIVLNFQPVFILLGTTAATAATAALVWAGRRLLPAPTARVVFG